MPKFKIVSYQTIIFTAEVDAATREEAIDKWDQNSGELLQVNSTSTEPEISTVEEISPDVAIVVNPESEEEPDVKD